MHVDLTAPDPDAVPKAYHYVSVIDGRKRALLAGPYDSHADALAKVDAVTAMAYTHDVKAWFYKYGTAGSDDVLPTVFGPV